MCEGEGVCVKVCVCVCVCEGEREGEGEFVCESVCVLDECNHFVPRECQRIFYVEELAKIIAQNS